YYASAFTGGGFGSLSTLNAGTGTTFCAGGVMFNITPNTDVTIDSFSAALAAAGTNLPVNVYYKMGTYVSSETNSAAWTLHASTTVSGNAAGALGLINLSNNPLTLLAGNT